MWLVAYLIGHHVGASGDAMIGCASDQSLQSYAILPLFVVPLLENVLLLHHSRPTCDGPSGNDGRGYQKGRMAISTRSSLLV